MTSILGLEERGEVYIGCDSSATHEQYYYAIASRKVFKNGSMIIGYTTSFRMGQLLQYALKIPVQDKSETDMHYLVTKFSAAVMAVFDTCGFLGKTEGQADFGGEFLIGYRHHLYCMYTDFTVLRAKSGIIGIGAGGAAASAALMAMSKSSDAAGRVKRALAISAKVCPYVAGPYYVEQLEQG